MALRKAFARPDLAGRLIRHFPMDLYFPREDRISEFLVPDILDEFRSVGADALLYADPIWDRNGTVSLDRATVKEICELAPTELILTDEGRHVAFLSVYDSFITLCLSRENRLREVISRRQWEAVICTPDTYLSRDLGRIV